MKRKKRSGPAHNEVTAVDPRAFTKLPEDAPAVSGEMSAARAQLLHSLQEANERCIQMLVHAARTEARDTFPLVNHLRPLLRELTPDVRTRAARTALLLVDMQLSNAEWWTHLLARPNRPSPPCPPGAAFLGHPRCLSGAPH
jgi:hypothetical protein